MVPPSEWMANGGGLRRWPATISGGGRECAINWQVWAGLLDIQSSGAACSNHPSLLPAAGGILQRLLPRSLLCSGAAAALLLHHAPAASRLFMLWEEETERWRGGAGATSKTCSGNE